MPSVDTIVAPSTPPGESALAVVRVSGPLAAAIAASLRNGRPPPPRRAWHGAYRDGNGVPIDEIIGCLFAGPASYTGEDVLEVSCHGNPLIINRIVTDLHARGCRLAEPGEFTRRAFLAGRLDLAQAEAVIDVIRARSDRALEQAQRQLRGDLGRRVAEMAERLLQTCAAVEAYIDFPEEDLPPEDREARMAEVAALGAAMEQLGASRRHGDLLREGVRVVLLGEPNTGKSTLLNRFAGYERAIVSEEPGTTRDFLEEGVLLGPHRIRILDTAGLRPAPAAVERAGVARAEEQAALADLTLLVVDVTRPSPTLPGAILARLRADNCIVVANKSDLAPRAFGRIDGLDAPTVPVSALSGAGFDALRSTLIQLLDRMTGSGSHDEGVSVNARHEQALADARQALARARTLLASRGPLELVASELHTARDELGRITGQMEREDVLDRLFARFCIGK